ncbi:MAG: hypothetical protein IKX86_03035, partial [Clostridia bacterium]|nr:hypothetical protein [Clostridia bacterium]
ILPDLVKIRNDLKNQLPLDENHSIPAATTKKVTTPAPETTKIPETSATGEITDPAPSTESVNDTFTDPPVTSDDTPATVTDIESSILSEETTAPVSDTEGGGELTEATETTVPEETVPPDGADSSASA